MGLDMRKSKQKRQKMERDIENLKICNKIYRKQKDETRYKKNKERRQEMEQAV